MDTHAIYQYLIESEKYHLTDQLNWQTFERGDYIYQPVDPQRYIYLISSGVAKIGSYSPEGEEVIYDLLLPSEFFGNLNYLDEEFFEFARAVSGLETLRFRLSFFKKIIVHDPVVSEWFNIMVVKRWAKAERRLLGMTRGNIDVRLHHLRTQIADVVEDKDGKSYEVFNLLSQQDIADLLGTTRQTIAKKMKKEEAKTSPRC